MAVDSHHREDLLRSGLTDETIQDSGIYSESDPRKNSQLLKWKRLAHKLGSCLVFPSRRLDGQFNGFVSLKPDNPRKSKGRNGEIKLIKYEHPLGVERQPYFGKLVTEALRQHLLVLFTEGIKKLLAIEQTGFACIGLSGVNAWSKTKESPSDPRVLNKYLADIDWTGVIAGVLFDTDERRNPDVNRESAYLACALATAGAVVHILRLPVGPRDSNGLPRKMGADDFIVEYGQDAFCRVINSQLDNRQNRRTLTDYRQAMSQARIDSLSQPGVYLDTSPAGAGKSYADIGAMQRVKTSLQIVPSHKNCEEVEMRCNEYEIPAVRFPKLDSETCQNFTEAENVLAVGLSVSGALCPRCEYNADCEYQYGCKDAESARHTIATHHRGALSFERLAEGRAYITIHEDSADFLRPALEIAVGLEQVAQAADEAITIAVRRQFGDDPDKSEEFYFRTMYNVANNLIEILQSSPSTASLDLPPAAGMPRGAEMRLYDAIQQAGVCPNPAAVQLVKSLAAGEIEELVVRVDEPLAKRRQKQIRRSVCGIRQNHLPAKTPVWVNDATGNSDDTEAMTGRSVQDMTPAGDLERQHPVLQIPLDVTKGTKRPSVISMVRGIVMRLPYDRIGVITHLKHVPAINGTAKSGPVLESEIRDRITRIEHFRSGESRGSNGWLEDCDCLIVVGTPRVPPAAIKSRLFKLGMPAAAARSEDWTAWGRDYWSGVTATGRRVTVQSRAYRDHDWHRAHQAIVRAELIQAAGRGRSITESGIPTVILSTEDLGLPILDINFEKSEEIDMKATSLVTELSDTFAK